MWPIRLGRLLIKTTKPHWESAKKRSRCLTLSGSKRSARDRWRKSIFAFPESSGVGTRTRSPPEFISGGLFRMRHLPMPASEVSFLSPP